MILKIINSKQLLVLIYHWFFKCYLDPAAWRQIVEKKLSDFKHGYANTDGAEHPGRPKWVVTLEIVNLQEISDTLRY